jgi:hypothetical protein
MITEHCFPTRAPLATLVILLAALGSGQGAAPPTDSADAIADSVFEFSDQQGKEGWFYGYWDCSTDANGQYDQASDFELLDRFGGDAENGLSKRREFTTGDLWYLEDGVAYTSLCANGGHASSPVALGDHAAPDQWVVRRWISDTAGMVTISGHAGKEMPWGRNWGGECQATIVVDGVTVLSTVTDDQGIDYAVAVRIKEKSTIDFLIAPNPSVGVVTFTAAIHKRPTTP